MSVFKKLILNKKNSPIKTHTFIHVIRLVNYFIPVILIANNYICDHVPETINIINITILYVPTNLGRV